MRKIFQTWKGSLWVVAQNPISLLALAILEVLWLLGAYQWLWLPESSALVLLVSLVWAAAQVMIAVAVLAGTAADIRE